MRYLPINWSEGMFLRPQHFQAADRFWSEQIATSERWDHAYNYGLQLIQFSDEAIANQQFELVKCHARLRDGTLVALSPGQEPDRVDLKEALQSHGQILVYLAVPKLVLGRTNVREPIGDQQSRYVLRAEAVQDEVRGGSDQEIDFRELDVRLLLSNEERGGYETLPIARIKRSSDTEATPQLDDAYIPPLLAIDAWSPLAVDIVRAIYDLIGERIDVLSQRVAQRGISLASQDPRDLDDFLMLTILNGAYGALRCLTFATGLHPLTVYAELSRIVAQLSIFHASRRPPEIPQYDHDDLAKIFRWMKQQIELLVRQVVRTSYEQRFFVGTERGMEVALEEKWLHAGWSWFVGVHADGVNDRECRELLKPGNLNWKIGSSRQVDLVFRRGLPGVGLIELPQPPRGLPTRLGWLYYEVNKNSENAAWRDVLATQTLAMRLTEELILNFDSLQGHRTLEVKNDRKRAALEFALFAVPMEKE